MAIAGYLITIDPPVSRNSTANWRRSYPARAVNRWRRFPRAGHS